MDSKDNYQINLNDLILQQQIDEGNFGKVCLVKDKKTGELLVAKILKYEIQPADKDSKLNFQRELNILLKLNHPSVLKFYGYSPVNFKNKSKPVLITEYAINKSLKYYIQESSNESTKSILNETQKLIIICGIAEAMSFLHFHGICHRDLKPANVLLDEFLFPKICDFGLSKSYDDKAKLVSNIKGTPLYMAPEIWTDGKYSEKSDVYAFAMIVYQLFTNDDLITNFSRYDAMDGKRPQLYDHIKKPYQDLIKECWSQNPEDRPSFDEILGKLRNDKSFITENVDKKLFFDYITYIDKSNISFNPSKKISFFDEYKKPFKFTKYLIRKIHIAPFKYVNKLDKECIDLIIEAENDSEKQFKLAKCIIKGLKHFPIDLQLGIKYLKLSMENGNIDSAIYYCKMLIKGSIIPMNLKRALKIIKTKLKELDNISTLFQGKIYIKEKKYSDAKNCFEQLIELGDENGMYEYGKLYEKGIGMPIDIEKALHYYKTSFQKGFLKAMYRYGFLLMKSEDEKKKEEGILYIKKAAEKGYPKAMYEYSTLLQEIDQEAFGDDNSEATLYMKKASQSGNISAIAKYCARFLQYKTTEDEVQESIQLLKTACDRGSLESILVYGSLLSKGEFVPYNPKEAAKYIEIAVYNEVETSFSIYGYMLYHGRCFPIDKEKAIKYYKKGIEKGETLSMNLYGAVLLSRTEDPNNIKEAEKYFKMAIDKGDDNAIFNYGVMIQKGYVENNEESLKYYKLAADKGNAVAMNNYAYALQNGIGIEANKEEAIKYYQMAIDKGYDMALNNYAVMLMNGDLNKRDVYEAKKYLHMAIDKGNINAMINYAYLLYEGIGMDANKNQALKYLKMAAELGNIDAKNRYAYYLIDTNDPINIMEGIECIQQLINKGSTDAMVFYGRCFEIGIGVEINKEEAIKYYKMAADNDNILGLSKYAHMLEFGEGVEANIEEAIKYYKMGIEKGDSDSMYYYAEMLENGIGIPVNIEEAVKYYQMAIEHGDSNAMRHYAHMLEHGEGVPVNKNEAEKYYKMASEKDNSPLTKDMVKINFNLIDT